MSPVATIIPDDAAVFDIAEEAVSQGLHLISNGRRFVISPEVPTGWHELIVKIKTPHLGHVAEAACAA